MSTKWFVILVITYVSLLFLVLFTTLSGWLMSTVGLVEAAHNKQCYDLLVGDGVESIDAGFACFNR